MTEIAKKKFEILNYTQSDEFTVDGLADKLNELTTLTEAVNKNNLLPRVGQRSEQFNLKQLWIMAQKLNMSDFKQAVEEIERLNCGYPYQDIETVREKEKARKAFVILRVVRRLLKWYVNIERFRYDPVCKFKEGQAVKLNWKAWAYFGDDQFYKIDHKMHFSKIDADNVVDTLEGDTWNLYWLCAG